MSDKELAAAIIEKVGGKENIVSVRHCATRLRLIVTDKDKIDTQAVEDMDNVKGSFFNAGQYQIILGTGLVNRIYDEVVKLVGHADAVASGSDQPQQKPVYGNAFQRAVRMFSDVFVPIIPVLVATGLFMGLRGLLTQEAVLNVFGLTAADVPAQLLTFTQILTDTAFSFLPALVCWSTGTSAPPSAAGTAGASRSTSSGGTTPATRSVRCPTSPLTIFPLNTPPAARGTSGFPPWRPRRTESVTPSWTLYPGGPWKKSRPWKGCPPPLRTPAKAPPWKSSFPTPPPG